MPTHTERDEERATRAGRTSRLDQAIADGYDPCENDHQPPRQTLPDDDPWMVMLRASVEQARAAKEMHR